MRTRMSADLFWCVLNDLRVMISWFLVVDLWADVFTFLSARPSCSKFKGTLFIACGADLSYVRVTQHRTLCTTLARFQLMIAFVFNRKECALLKSYNNRNKYWNILAHLLLNITNGPIYFLKLRNSSFE